MKNDKITWTEVAELYGDDLQSMKVDLMKQAFELPILDYETGNRSEE